MTPISAAFVPLTDSAVLIAAERMGFAAQEGIQLNLERERSWATARDRLIYGHVQIAHMLAPLAVAVSLGLGHPPVSLSAPFKLGLNGNALTLSKDLAAALDPDPVRRVTDAVGTAHDLAAAIGLHRRKPIIGIVHRYSSHALTLRYWLAFAGIDPDKDVILRVVPPPFMADALHAGDIDGFIAGEPWSSVAVADGVGEIVSFGSNVWRRGVEKVLAMRTDWMESEPDLVDRLLRALDKSAAWCDDAANSQSLAEMLADRQVIDQPAELIAHALQGRIALSQGTEPVEAPDFLMFHREAANFPWRSQALWIYSQFVRWGFVEPSDKARILAEDVFRSDIYRRALTGGTTPLPGASLKVEGALLKSVNAGSDSGTLTLGPDRFFDGRIFDPYAIEDYLKSFTAGPA